MIQRRLNFTRCSLLASRAALAQRPKSAHEGREVRPTGDGPASSPEGVKPPPSSPAGECGVAGAPGEEVPFAPKSAQDGFKTRRRREEDDKMTTRRHQDDTMTS